MRRLLLALVTGTIAAVAVTASMQQHGVVQEPSSSTAANGERAVRAVFRDWSANDGKFTGKHSCRAAQLALTRLDGVTDAPQPYVIAEFVQLRASACRLPTPAS